MGACSSLFFLVIKEQFRDYSYWSWDLHPGQSSKVWTFYCTKSCFKELEECQPLSPLTASFCHPSAKEKSHNQRSRLRQPPDGSVLLKASKCLQVSLPKMSIHFWSRKFIWIPNPQWRCSFSLLFVAIKHGDNYGEYN